jgi:hypothetical protein
MNVPLLSHVLPATELIGAKQYGAIIPAQSRYLLKGI